MSAESFEPFLVGGVLALLFACFVREWLKPDVAVMVAVALLLACGVLETRQVLSVFSNSAPITIACLFVVSAALQKTGCVARLGDLLGSLSRGTEKGILLGLLVCGLVVSPFINNTPVVMILMPAVVATAARFNIAPSRLLIPLSYSTILGGLATLMGTSTNILVDGVARDMGLKPFTMFEITVPALILALVSFVFIYFAAPRWLPVRKTLTERFGEVERTFTSELLVPAGSRLVGHSLRDAHLGAGASVLRLVRGEQALAAPDQDTVLQQGDRLVIATRSSDMVHLRGTDLVSFESSHVERQRAPGAVILEVVVGKTSRYVARPLDDLDLVARYGVHLLAVHRQDANIEDVVGDLQLEFGDVLLVEGTREQLRRFCDNGDLMVLNEAQEVRYRTRKAPIALAAIAGIVVLSALGVMPIEGLALIGAALVVATGCVRPDETYKVIEWPILILIFGMLAISIAMRESGLAHMLAQGLVGLGQGWSPWMILALSLLLISLVTELISNNAVAVLFTPVMVVVAQQLGVDPRPFVVGVMFMASCSFATPIGYQTNTLVYSAGNYRFSDFARLGIPLNILVWIGCVILIPLFWPFHPA